MRVLRTEGDPGGIWFVDIIDNPSQGDKAKEWPVRVQFVPTGGRDGLAILVKGKDWLDLAGSENDPCNDKPLTVRDVIALIRPLLRQGYKAALTRMANGRDWRPNDGRNM